MVIGAGVVVLVSGISARTTWLCGLGLGFSSIGFAAVRGYRWTSRAYLALGLALLLTSAWWINARGFTWRRATGIGGSLVCITLALADVRRRRRKHSAPESPILSLVLLERTPRYLDDRLLASIASSAWGGDFGVRDEGHSRFVVGEPPTMTVKSPDGSFLIHTLARPFWDRCEDIASLLADVRAQRALREHQAWISVNLLDTTVGGSREKAFGQVGRLLAELAGPDTLAVVQPESGSFRVWDESVAEILRNASSLDCLSFPNAAPVVQVSPDDPLMAKAVAEARRRWSEFTRAFSGRHPEQHFSVKAPVTRGGQTEHIWIDVLAISSENIRGKLGNDPIDLNGLKLGDPISVPISTIEDWLYVLTDKPVGGFTIPAVTSAPWRARRS